MVNAPTSSTSPNKSVSMMMGCPPPRDDFAAAIAAWKKRLLNNSRDAVGIRTRIFGAYSLICSLQWKHGVVKALSLIYTSYIANLRFIVFLSLVLGVSSGLFTMQGSRCLYWA